MKTRSILLIIIALSSFAFSLPQTASSSSDAGGYSLLAEGKKALEQGNSGLAIERLTAATEAAPILGDYVLLWRSRAYEKRGETEKALADLRSIKERYADSPLLRDARKRELEITAKRGDALSKEAADLFTAFFRDYPSDFATKYLYASCLQEGGEREKARNLFREIYRSSSSLSSKALKDLSPSDITATDLIERGNSLNKAWLFPEAENCFREALARLKRESDTGKKAVDGLAYALFHQKRYKEAAGLYKEINSPYWRARALLRAGEMASLEEEVPGLLKSSDKRMATVLVALGTKKRREGDTETAIRIFDSVISRFPAEKEEALWAKAWTQYLSGRRREAGEIMAQLHDATGDARYLYWKERCRDASAAVPAKASSGRISHRNFYGYISRIKAPGALTMTGLKEEGSFFSGDIALSERVAILRDLGLRQEAVAELMHLARKAGSPEKLRLISSSLKDMGNYRASVTIASKAPYCEELHGLFYPKAFPPAVEEAAKRSGLDPFLILSVIREESRFDPQARSIAGALGPMQLMPQTARKVAKGIPDVSPEELTLPRTNIIIGSQYLLHLVETFRSIPLAIAAYNAGEEAVKNWLRKGSCSTVDEFIEDIPYDETRNYVKKVMTSYFEYMKWRGSEGLSAAQINMGSL
ncbi:MAG: lytic transglycosylase domain-containing protein [Thermodesulfovibrionales bacterium]|jgi:soluble lytic murein transglycosylase